MNARKDFEKILNYAKSHGIKVIFRLRKPKQVDCAWISFESKTIVVTYRLRDSFQVLCSSLLHEMSHLVAYSLDKKSFNDYFRASSMDNPTYLDRRAIYLREKGDVALMPKLCRLLRLEAVPLNFIKKERDYDIWQYKFYMDKGRFPNRKEKDAKKIYFKNKWKL